VKPIFKQTGNIYIWLTNDEYKIPVKLESKISFGSFTASLVSAQACPLEAEMSINLLETKAYDYPLPAEMIAQYPTDKREQLTLDAPKLQR